MYSTYYLQYFLSNFPANHVFEGGNNHRRHVRDQVSDLQLSPVCCRNSKGCGLSSTVCSLHCPGALSRSKRVYTSYLLATYHTLHLAFLSTLIIADPTYPPCCTFSPRNPCRQRSIRQRLAQPRPEPPEALVDSICSSLHDYMTTSYNRHLNDSTATKEPSITCPSWWMQVQLKFGFTPHWFCVVGDSREASA